jgi:hypothetical protein
MKQLGLSFNSRKALSVNLGDEAAEEIVGLFEQLTKRIQELERGKVDVLQIVPSPTTRKKTYSARKAA